MNTTKLVDLLPKPKDKVFRIVGFDYFGGGCPGHLKKVTDSKEG